MKDAVFDRYKDYMSFATNVVLFLRETVAIEREKPDAWKPLDDLCQSLTERVREISTRVERLSRLLERAEDVERLWVLLSVSSVGQQTQAKLPCIMLPAAKHARFFDRDDIIESIDKYFGATSGESGSRSLALLGLGGVGKSHTALKYAHSKSQQLQAIFWVHSETEQALEQSFTDIAIRLKFEGAELQKHLENKVMVLDWLQQTTCQWLMIFDNAAEPNVVQDYWPVAQQGRMLITTRNRNFAFGPAEAGIDILHFDKEAGARFILHMLSWDIADEITEQESVSAFDLSERLAGSGEYSTCRSS